jgi:hypothetical protein
MRADTTEFFSVPGAGSRRVIDRLSRLKATAYSGAVCAREPLPLLPFSAIALTAALAGELAGYGHDVPRP